MTQADYDEASSKALSLFEYGQVTLFPFFLSNSSGQAPCHSAERQVPPLASPIMLDGAVLII